MAQRVSTGRRRGDAAARSGGGVRANDRAPRPRPARASRAPARRAGRLAAGRLAAGLLAAGLLAAGLLGAGGAGAADLAAPPPASGPAFVDWSGGYLGLQGSAGAAFGDVDLGPTTVGGRTVPRLRTGDGTGRFDLGRAATTAVGGAFAGWNWQSGPALAGIEADLSGTNLTRAVDAPFGFVRTRTDLLGALRGRLGYAVERTLVYASVGSLEAFSVAMAG